MRHTARRTATGSGSTCISNFRSREEVLGSVNFIFEQIMRRELGGICYDGQAALYPGASYDPQLDGQGRSLNRAELILVDTSDDGLAGETGREREARAVARRIKELLLSGRVLDKASGTYRAPRYKDIVILTRSIKGWADVFAAVLGEEGIPAYAGSREGYFETYEVSVLLDYLRILDNFMQESAADGCTDLPVCRSERAAAGGHPQCISGTSLL